MGKTGWLAGGSCFMSLIVALAQPGGPPGPEDPHEKFILLTLVSLEQMTKTLATVKDEGSAAAARPKLKESADLFLATRKKAGELPQPELKHKQQLEEKYQKKLSEAVDGLKKEMRRVQDVPGGPTLLKELDEVLKPPKKKPADSR